MRDREIAINRSGPATRCVNSRIFQRHSQFLLMCFQGRNFRLQFVDALFLFTSCLGNRIACLGVGAFLGFLLSQANSAPRRVIGYPLFEPEPEVSAVRADVAFDFSK